MNDTPETALFGKRLRTSNTNNLEDQATAGGFQFNTDNHLRQGRCMQLISNWNWRRCQRRMMLFPRRLSWKRATQAGVSNRILWSWVGSDKCRCCADQKEPPFLGYPRKKNTKCSACTNFGHGRGDACQKDKNMGSRRSDKCEKTMSHDFSVLWNRAMPMKVSKDESVTFPERRWISTCGNFLWS